MGKMSRDKGARGEREVAKRFSDAGFKARRAVGQFAHGSDLPDVEVDLPFWVESKLGARTNVRAALEQAEEALNDNGKKLVAISVCRNDREGDSIVGIRFTHFLELCRIAFPPKAGPPAQGNGGIPSARSKGAPARTDPARQEGSQSAGVAEPEQLAFA